MDIFENRNFSPMLLSEEKEPFDNEEYFFEIKFDGIRALCFTDGNSICFKTRNGKDITNMYPELHSIKSLVNKKVIFDGEIVIFEDGVSSFSAIEDRLHLKDKKKINYLSVNNPVTFVVFDILYENKDLTKFSLGERKKILEKYKDNEVFIKSKYFNTNGTKVFQMVKKLGFEGMVAKKINSKYQINKRSKDWIKVKNLSLEYYYVYGYIENKDTISLLLGEVKDNMIFYVGKVHASKKHECYKLIKDSKITFNPFVNYDDKYAIFIEPKYKCFVEYLEKTKGNHLRHPILRKFE